MITYEEFIQNILDTRGRFNCGDEYHERHHIVPKCLGGSDEKNNLIDLYATQAAIRAVYSAKTAYAIGQENLKKLEIRAYIDERLEEIKSKSIADATEVMQYLTSVLRGEEKEEVIVVEGCGDGISSARHINKDVGTRDKLKAAELLAKRYGLLTDKVGIEGVVPVVISGGENLED